jgi:heat shock protein HslJ
MRLNANDTDFSEVLGRHWNLTEVKNKSVTINIDRTNVPTDIYTIKFEPTHLTGTGAVNFYSASYTARENHRLSIVGIARICDDTLYEMEEFTENEYLRYLQRTNGWDIHGEKLELYTYDENGTRAIMIFFQSDKTVSS